MNSPKKKNGSSPTSFSPPKPGSTASRAVAIRRHRMRRRPEESIEVDLSPLIDCVFLLLIFFLVTTMLKKLEKQIPVVLPDYTAALSSVAETDMVIYAMDAEANVYRADSMDRSRDGIRYQRIDSLAESLRDLAQERGTRVPVRIDTDRMVPVQKVIDMLDTFSLQEFENVGVRLRHRQDEFFLLEGIGR